ncbi:hypothetical protein C8F01DRAFT_1101955, partial [Mycena amicta]
MPSVDLDHQITRMQSALRRYVAKRSPAPQLPIELWDLIFEMSGDDSPEASLLHSPLNVSQVCRHWRSIVLSNSALWSTLAVTAPEHAPSLEAFHRIVQLWLRRSGKRLLTVSLAQSDSVKSAAPLSLALEAVVGNADRLRSLRFHGPEASLFPLERPELCFPVLEHLHINSRWPMVAASDLVIILSGARRLRSLTARHTSFDAGHIGGLDYQQLTELTLLPDGRSSPNTFWTSDEALALLSDAPHLTKLRLAINDTMPRRHTLTHAAALRSLSLEFRDASSGTSSRSVRIGAFFSLLYTPNLEHISLRDCGAAYPVIWPHPQSLGSWPQAQFLSYLGATQLRSLHLAHLPLYETQVIECLQQVPNVAELVLEVPSAPRLATERRGYSPRSSDVLKLERPAQTHCLSPSQCGVPALWETVHGTGAHLDGRLESRCTGVSARASVRAAQPRIGETRGKLEYGRRCAIL